MKDDMFEFVIRPKGAFSLAQSKSFLAGFTPASGTSRATDETLDLAFRLDRTFEAVGVRLRQDARGAVHGAVYGTKKGEEAASQVARMLALDVDGRGFDRLTEKDPLLKKAIASFPGFRPVSFASPYEAAVWGILAQRVSMKQAAVLRRKIAESLGDVVRIDGGAMAVFPSPKALLAGKKPEGLPEEKWARLGETARAAIAGILDANYLRTKTPEEALTELASLRGVGGWTSGHILLRGTGAVDLIALHEPRVRAAIEHLLGRASSDDEVVELSRRWSPYRTWAMVLAVLSLSRAGKWAVKGAKRGFRVPGAKKKAGASRSPQRAKSTRGGAESRPANKIVKSKAARKTSTRAK